MKVILFNGVQSTMIFLTRKNGNTGEIKLVITELDRAEFTLHGYRWVSLNDTINTFNQDSEVTNLMITAVYAGDIKDDRLNECITNITNNNSKSDDDDDDNKSDNKQKILVTGSDKKDNNTTLENFLKDYDLTCKKCGDSGKALIDSKGNIHDCEACLKIDAYLKGKKEGYDQGWLECSKYFQTLINKSNTEKSN